MSESTVNSESSSRSLNPSVERCCAAFQDALNASGGIAAPGARDAADAAYHNALPQLVDRRSIQDFIACVAHGMVFSIFRQGEGPHLIIAAKAALSALPPEPRPAAATSDRRPPGRPPKGAAGN